jgi:5-methylcytosine-specific restriction endonuclease McrA
MGKKVLVLNQDYSALSVCSIPKAFLLVYLQKAELIVEDHSSPLRTIRSKFPKPSIIRLVRYVNLPYRNGVVLNRQNVFKRDGNSCVYCGSTKDLTLDHVMPRSRGGRTSWDNLVTACKSCNSRKGDNTPEEANMLLKQPPFKPSFVMYLRDFHERLNDEWLTFLGARKGA